MCAADAALFLSLSVFLLQARVCTCTRRCVYVWVCVCVRVSKHNPWDDVNLAQRAGDTHERLAKAKYFPGADLTQHVRKCQTCASNKIVLCLEDEGR